MYSPDTLLYLAKPRKSACGHHISHRCPRLLTLNHQIVCRRRFHQYSIRKSASQLASTIARVCLGGSLMERVHNLVRLRILWEVYLLNRLLYEHDNITNVLILKLVSDLTLAHISKDFPMDLCHAMAYHSVGLQDR